MSDNMQFQKPQLDPGQITLSIATGKDTPATVVLAWIDADGDTESWYVNGDALQYLGNTLTWASGGDKPEVPLFALTFALPEGASWQLSCPPLPAGDGQTSVMYHGFSNKVGDDATYETYLQFVYGSPGVGIVGIGWWQPPPASASGVTNITPTGDFSPVLDLDDGYCGVTQMVVSATT
jgi:hypothetical protein